jgi:hypothetical protein
MHRNPDNSGNCVPGRARHCGRCAYIEPKKRKTSSGTHPAQGGGTTSSASSQIKALATLAAIPCSQ